MLGLGHIKELLVEFRDDEQGQMHVTPSFLMATLVLAIPMGLIFFAVYGALIRAGYQANTIIGLF